MLEQNYIDGNTIDEVLAFNFVVDGQPLDWRYLLHDHLYSPVALMSEAGAIWQRYEYDAYGRRSALTEAFAPSTLDYGHDIAFTGRQLDILDSGTLHHMHYRHRDYNPQLGRFMQHDPFGINPQPYKENFFFIDLLHYFDGLSLYEYVSSKPLNQFDPFGLMIIMPIPNPIVDPITPNPTPKPSPKPCPDDKLTDYEKCMRDARDAAIACGIRGGLYCAGICKWSGPKYPVCVPLCSAAYAAACFVDMRNAENECINKYR